MAKKRPPTEHEAATAAYHTLKDEGLLPPRSTDDVAQLEEEFGCYPKSAMNAADALKLAKGQSPLPKAQLPTPFADLNAVINQDLGIAARKGSEIPADVWAKMKADRVKSRDESHRQRG
jgi:hypothetical protein